MIENSLLVFIKLSGPWAMDTQQFLTDHFSYKKLVIKEASKKLSALWEYLMGLH